MTKAQATPEQKALATKILGSAFGVHKREPRQLSEAAQTVADMVAGRSRPEPGTDEALLAELLSGHRTAAHSSSVQPSEAMQAAVDVAVQRALAKLNKGTK